MLKVWHDEAWAEYLWWQDNDRKGLRRVNRLIKEIERAGEDGKPIGKAERLRYSANGLCSVRIDQANRLVSKVEDGRLVILACRGHYENT